MPIDLSSLKNALGLPIIYFDSIDSTSLFCKEQIKNGAPFEGLVIAGKQTNGQGRVGKSFYSPDGTGLYLTFCLKRSMFSQTDLTPCVALAVCKAIEKVFPVSCGVKWVNDVYLGGRKVAGVLCQIVENYLLIGIGINLQKPEIIPNELCERFGWVSDDASDEKRFDLICSLYHFICCYCKEYHEEFLLEYRERCVHIGKQVSIEQSNFLIQGTCVGIDRDFSLLVETNNKIHSFSSGYMVLKI